MNLGIVIIATNAYFVLGIRLIKKFRHHYKGNNNLTFYFFSDVDPSPYCPNEELVYINQEHTCWAEATNSKFRNILSLEKCKSDYLYYFDADTNIDKDFTDEWFLGELVGGEHYGNRTFLKGPVGFDHNPQSKAYVPSDTKLPCTYYYGAFFGGITSKVVDLCEVLYNNQLEDKKIPYEPVVNDESYLNQYFHYNPPITIPTEEFQFIVSDKGGLGETRDISLNTDNLKNQIREHPTRLFDIKENQIIWFN